MFGGQEVAAWFWGEGERRGGFRGRSLGVDAFVDNPCVLQARRRGEFACRCVYTACRVQTLPSQSGGHLRERNGRMRFRVARLADRPAPTHADLTMAKALGGPGDKGKTNPEVGSLLCSCLHPCRFPSPRTHPAHHHPPRNSSPPATAPVSNPP